MKRNIAEDLPTRKHPQAQLNVQSKKPERFEKRSDNVSSGEKTPEERVSQAASDIRYRARRERITLMTAYSQYMQNSDMPEDLKSAVRQKLFGRGGTQAENFEMDMKVSASNSMAKALYKVFVEKKNEVIDENQLKNELEEASNLSTSESKKYKVRVTDPENNITYVRYANREKISQLRAKGLEVEMTEYGTPYEGERTKGEKTAEVLGKKAKKDYDGDGKIESGAKEYRGSVHNAIKRKMGGVADGKDTSNVKESFIGEVAATANLPQMDSSQIANPDSNLNQIDILPPNKKNKVVVNPTNTVLAHTELYGDVILETGYSKFLGMLQEKRMTKKEKTKEKKLKKKYDPSGMKASMRNQYGEEEGKRVYFATIRKQAMKEESDCGCEEEDKMNLKKDEKMDSRAVPTALSIAKLGARYRGAKNPIIMSASYEPEGEMVDEASAAARRGVAEPHRGDVVGRRKKAKASLAAAKKGGETRRKGAERFAQSGNPEIAQRLLTTKSKPEKEHAEKFPGSRQKPKPKPVSGTVKTPEGKEVAKEEEREKTIASNRRPLTTKQKKESKAREPYDSSRD